MSTAMEEPQPAYELVSSTVIFLNAGVLLEYPGSPGVRRRAYFRCPSFQSM